MDLKNEVLTKSKKKATLCKGLLHGFCQKIDLFLICFFVSQKKQKKTFFDILYRKECFLDHKREVLKMFKKSTFCKGVSPWFFLKNGRFPNLFFWAEKARKKHFFIFWIVKNAFETWKVKFQQSKKNRHFAKGLVHGFCQKINLFLVCFFLSQTRRKKTFFDILDRKEWFFDHKR